MAMLTKSNIKAMSSFINNSLDPIKSIKDRNFKSLREVKSIDTIAFEMPINHLKIDIKEDKQDMGFLPVEVVLKFKLDVRVESMPVYALINGPANTIEISLYYDYTFVNVVKVDVNKLQENDTVVKDDMDNIDFYIPDAFRDHYSKLISVDTVNFAKSLFAFTLDAMCYVKQTIASRETIIKTERKARKSKSAGPSTGAATKRKATVLNENKVIYRIETTDKAFDTIRKYRKYKGSFNVMGHPRKLKSGKVTWVKPYIKGQGEKIRKDYIIK